MKIKGLVIIFVFLMTAFLGGCTGSTPSSQAEGYFQTELKPATTPVSTGQEVIYTVTVSHEEQPVSGAKVEVALEMKEMDHGQNQFSVQEVSPGVYKGKAILPMSGEWQAYIRVEKDGKNETLLSSFEAVGEMIEHK